MERRFCTQGESANHAQRPELRVSGHAIPATFESQPYLSLLRFRRHSKRHEKPRDHVVGGDSAGEFDDLRSVKVLPELRKNLVTDFHVEGHLRSVLHH